MAYMGGKGNCYRQIVAALPVHDVYIETHLGGGAVMRAKRPASRQIGIDIDPHVIDNWRSQPAPCELVRSDARLFLERFPFGGRELVYADPPYPASVRANRNRYRFEYSDEDHEGLLDVLCRLPCAVIVSGSPESSLYRERLRSWRSKPFTSGARAGRRSEMIWMNFDPHQRPYDPRFAGDNFRDREKRKRRRLSLTGRIEKLPTEERSWLAEWFAERYPNEIVRLKRGSS